MFIRHHGNRRAEAASSSNPSSSKRCALQDDETAAAVKIQSIWRGRKERRDWKKRRCRNKPWGYYTHTLTLTFISTVRAERELGRHALYQLLEEPGSGRAASAASVLIVLVILISIVMFLVETLPEASSHKAQLACFCLEVFCTAIFTVEYCARLAVCEEGGTSKLRFLTSPMNVFDLLAVVPFYIDLFMRALGETSDVLLKLLRLVRMARLVRIFKLGRYASGLRLMGEALVNSSQAISVLVFLLCMGVVLFSSALFHMEKLSCAKVDNMDAAETKEYESECADEYNNKWSPSHGLCCTKHDAPLDFPSIIATMWWSMATMTSVGYGDVYPRTAQGKCVGFVAMLVGMVLIALPVAIVGQKFQDVYDRRDLEEAKLRAATRMKTEGKTWSLVPTSDVIQRLRQYRFKDPVLASSIDGLATSLEDVWERREQLSRLRKVEFEKQESLIARMGTTLEGMYAVSTGSPCPERPRRRSMS